MEYIFGFLIGIGYDFGKRSVGGGNEKNEKNEKNNLLKIKNYDQIHRRIATYIDPNDKYTEHLNMTLADRSREKIYQEKMFPKLDCTQDTYFQLVSEGKIKALKLLINKECPSKDPNMLKRILFHSIAENQLPIFQWLILHKNVHRRLHPSQHWEMLRSIFTHGRTNVLEWLDTLPNDVFNLNQHLDNFLYHPPRFEGGFDVWAFLVDRDYYDLFRWIEEKLKENSVGTRLEDEDQGHTWSKMNALLQHYHSYDPYETLFNHNMRPTGKLAKYIDDKYF